ncbi:MAG TPA: SRPBCC family protein [Mycobacteriales bacterium]|jgi:uncharacterized protein YndB with AHSA1/START domain
MNEVADIEVVRDGERWTLVFARDLPQPPVEVWRALTDPERLRAWAPYTADRDLGATGPATLTMTDREGGDAIAIDVTTADAPRTLEHTWGGDVLRWELAPAGTGTRLTLRHTVDERAGTPGYAAGWHLCLAVLAGELPGPVVGERAKEFGWDALRDSYAAALGA